jgi:hypothetical protein
MILGDRTGTLEFELVLVHKNISDALGVLCGYHQVVHIERDVLVYITVLAHPDAGFQLGRFKTHISETIGEAFVPAQTRSPEAVQCLEDNQGMPLAFSKFGTSKEG